MNKTTLIEMNLAHVADASDYILEELSDEAKLAMLPDHATAFLAEEYSQLKGKLNVAKDLSKDGSLEALYELTRNMVKRSDFLIKVIEFYTT